MWKICFPPDRASTLKGKNSGSKFCPLRVASNFKRFRDTREATSLSAKVVPLCRWQQILPGVSVHHKAYADSKSLDEPVHLSSLIITYIVCLQNLPCQGSVV